MQLSKKTLFKKWKRDNEEEVDEMTVKMRKEGLNSKDIEFNLSFIFNIRHEMETRLEKEGSNDDGRNV